ncbi:nucleotidyltransferase family protein [Paucibacter sp. O1-1]|uniref:nucleotidyltransferase family protein n=1 Tax=Paucibacter sp. M5-1 TaxID=3015998 RepID=UPI0021D4E5D2|nr:nucleotidyltransferase family protein [Paucibacter sp. M5-1]MCU7375413.1 nucleotidyltransferase family protein [Paucibacter sp. O1-1]MCZ7884584.1 nucleotidyltransferase family protein [Paucibacter sp. M5-1]MDA3830420.1 nucleotidyltransferase family protein [Paucibacter sp. O1-1]
MMKRRPVVVVLAAGRGMRFRGQGHKLEQALGPETLLSQTLKNAVQTGLRVVVVTSESLAGAVRDTVAVRDIIVMPELDEKGRPSPVGMGHSIAAGVAATGDAEGWLIVPADMPMLRASSILRVAEGLEQYPISFAQYKGRRGHPVGFNAELFSELVGLQGDEGARRLIARYPSQGLEVDDPGVLLDIDTTEDLARLRASSASALPD